jgi:hypothetical protein
MTEVKGSMPEPPFSLDDETVCALADVLRRVWRDTPDGDAFPRMAQAALNHVTTSTGQALAHAQVRLADTGHLDTVTQALSDTEDRLENVRDLREKYENEEGGIDPEDGWRFLRDLDAALGPAKPRVTSSPVDTPFPWSGAGS